MLCVSVGHYWQRGAQRVDCQQKGGTQPARQVRLLPIRGKIRNGPAERGKNEPQVTLPGSIAALMALIPRSIVG